MERRKINPETKLAAVLVGLKGESSIADICRKYQIAKVFTIDSGQVPGSWQSGPGFPEWLQPRAQRPCQFRGIDLTRRTQIEADSLTQ